MGTIRQRGANPIDDLLHALPKLSVDLIVDVGANRGQSAKRFLENFPAATLHCFEPAPATFSRLEREVLRHARRAIGWQCALAAEDGNGQMVLEGTSDQWRLATDDHPSSDKRMMVPTVTLDSFCARQGISRINYLKVDTEGGDLAVMQGAKTMLAEQRIDLIELEAGVNPRNDVHVPFETLKHHLEARDYYLFGIYEQIHEWPSRRPHLRRINPVFISHQVSEANEQPDIRFPV